MNLIIDIGNSSTKVGIFDGPEKINVIRTKDFTCEEFEDKISSYKIEKAIVSSVKKMPPLIVDMFAVNIPFVHFLSHKSILPFKIAYGTPETLGTDRIAGVAGAFSIFPGSDLLVIDAGTAITYDFLSEGIYKGGNISPGLNMRFKALNKFTRKLPLLSPSPKFTNPGQNTSDAILAGVITGVTYEINEYIRTFEKMSREFNILLTGGDSGFLKDRIDRQITYVPDLVIDGLNYILEYNAE